MPDNKQSTDTSIFGVREYVDMSQRISRLEKFEEQMGSRVERFEEKISIRLTVRDEEIDEKLKSLEEQIDKQHKVTTDLIRTEISSVKSELKQDARSSTESIERRQEVIRSEIGSTKAELRCDVKVVSDSIEVKHKTLTTEVKEIHETIIKVGTTIKVIVSVGGALVALATASSWLFDHKVMLASFIH